MTQAGDVSIRVATSDDVAAIVALLRDDPLGRVREGEVPRDLALYERAFEAIDADPGSQVFVAVIGEDAGAPIVGCLQLTTIPGLSYRGVRRALIEDVRVAVPHRGCGIGAFLLAHAEAQAHARGCRLVELFVHGDRADAQRFYERAGYSGAHRGFRKHLGDG